MEQELAQLESLISRVRARQVQLIHALDSAQVATSDGCRTMAEWVSARLDMSPGLARQLAALSQRVDPQAREALERGEASFDRAVAVTGLAAVGVEDAFERSLGFDLSGVNRWAARHRRIVPMDEQAAFAGRYLVLQPNLDESSWKLWGQLPGIDGQLVDQALNRKADQIPTDIPATRSQRRADALTGVCAEALGARTGSEEAGFQITVIVDAAEAAGSKGEAGVELLAGPRLGASGLAEALCSGDLAAFTNHESQLYRIGVGGNTIPPAVRRYVLARDRACVIDGCRSRYRLQVHHIRERANGGSHHPDNLATVCWYHHHVAIHGQQLRIDQNSPPQRRRLVSTERSPP